MPHVLPLSLRHRQPGRIRPQLDGLRQALAALGNPQQHFESLLIVGTNGKGSTAAILDAVLAAHGITTGLYTSPHLVRVEERIRIAGKAISSGALEVQLDRLSAFAELTFFETITAAALAAFAEAGVGCAVLEAGLGGSWDATRAASSAVVGITNVGTDHQRWLGPDCQAVAREKGRALRAADLGVLGPDIDEAIIAHLQAPHAVPAKQLVQLTRSGAGRVRVRCHPSGPETEFVIPMPGAHQQANLHLALAMAGAAAQRGLLDALDPAAIERGLARVRWPGRLSVHCIRSRRVLLDCAHNSEAATALARHLAGQDTRYNLLFSCLQDKPVAAMARVLRPQVGKIVLCPLPDERAMTRAQLSAAFPAATWEPDPIRALDALPDPVIGAGSVRLVGALLEHDSSEVW